MKKILPNSDGHAQDVTSSNDWRNSTEKVLKNFLGNIRKSPTPTINNSANTELAMAEAAAAAVAYETVETAAQVGVGAYMVAKPTMPLKATFTRIATSSDDETRYPPNNRFH